MNNFVMGAIVLAIIILLIFLLVTSEVFEYDKPDLIIEDNDLILPISCNCIGEHITSPNVQARIKNKIRNLAKEEILKHEGTPKDIDRMNLNIENVHSTNKYIVEIKYSFRLPKHRRWISNTYERVKRTETINWKQN